MIVSSEKSGSTRRVAFSASIVIAFAVAHAVALAPHVAHAQSSGEKGNVAEALFREGVALFDKGRVHEACEKFAESFRIDPANGTLQDLALCHEREGKIASAWAEFSQLAGRASQANQKEREQMARTKAAELEPKVTRVRLVFARVGGAESNVEKVTVDGHELGRPAWSSPLPLDPGDHAFEFSAHAKKNASRSVRIATEGQIVTLEVPSLEDAPLGDASSARTAAPRDEGTPGRRTAGYVILGVSAIALGVGAYFGLATIGKKHDGDAHCNGRLCDAQGLALESDAHTYASASTIAFGAGAVALGAGIFLLVTSRDASAPSDAASPTAARESGPRVRLVPHAHARGGGLAAEVRW